MVVDRSLVNELNKVRGKQMDQNKVLNEELFIINNMEVEHLPEVIAIESYSFPTPWTYSSFYYEIENNDLADYIIVLKDNKVIGYAGIWLIIDEAHLTNIAVAEEYRGQQLGEIMIIELIRRVKSKGGTRMTLEVRPSNLKALSLYTRMGFISYGLRKGYYTDNNEDAIIMWKEL
jgi:[ribosomal protein S18]-alanine N-acetyltransferase